MTATPTSVVTSAVSGLDSDMLTVAAAGVGIGATVLVVRKGWRLVKGFF